MEYSVALKYAIEIALKPRRFSVIQYMFFNTKRLANLQSMFSFAALT